MDLSLYLIFLATTVMLILMPGPAAITVASQGATNTSNKAFFGVLGVATADVIFFALSATGIASLIIASNLMFSAVKWVGVMYLLYLGLGALLSQSGAIKINRQQAQGRAPKLFSQGLVIQLANPKALLYFSALLPQFIAPGEPIFFQILVMGVSCFLADLLIYSVYSHLGYRLAKQTLKQWVISLINKVAGITLISTAVKMASLEYSK
ncbi:MAG: LysE family translocator [Porticoccus sp.]